MNRYVTLGQLEVKVACAHARELFEQRFGRRVVVTEERCADNAEGFNWHWASMYLLTGRQRHIFNRRRDKVLATHKAAYKILAEARDRRIGAIETLREIVEAGARELVTKLQNFPQAQFSTDKLVISKQMDTAMAVAFAKAYNSRK